MLSSMPPKRNYARVGRINRMRDAVVQLVEGPPGKSETMLVRMVGPLGGHR